jgi:hypothetical protein
VDKLPKAEAAHLARINAVAATLPNHLKAARVEAAEKKLMVAIGAYIDAVAVYSDALSAAWSELMRCEPLPAGFAAKAGNGSVRLNGVNYPQLDAQGGLVALARTAISAKSPRTALRRTAHRCGACTMPQSGGRWLERGA